MNNNSLLLDQCSYISEIQQPVSCSELLNGNDIQVIHYNLYPLLFQYVDRFIQKETISDSLIAELFFQMIKNDELNNDLKKMIIFSFKKAREMCASYLQKDSAFLGELIKFVRADFKEVAQKDLLLFNEMNSFSKELLFLRYGFGLDLYDIAEVFDFSYQDVALTYSKIKNKTLQ